MPRCSIGLGGNLGDVAATFALALQRLQQSHCVVIAVSRLYVTHAMGPQAGDDFHNACALLETELDPHGLLQLVQGIEDEAGRMRSVRWGARTLDLDVLTYDDLVWQDPQLTLPHPGIVYRRFVLDPLVEVAPELVHPMLGRSVRDLQQRLLGRPLRIVLREGRGDETDRIVAGLTSRFAGLIQIDVGGTAAADATVIDLGGDGSVEQRPLPPSVVVRLDPQIAHDDPLAATVAVVAALLDEPLPVGPIRLPVG